MQIGDKLKRLRLRTNLTQEELAIRCDLSKGFISQIERDQSSPSIATLVDILECMGTTPAEFFREPTAEPTVCYKQDDAYTIDDETLKHRITWIIPNAQKNDMEPILLTLFPNGRTQEYAPHAGEVFGYVLSGSITLHRGKHKWKIKKGDSIYYPASQPYYLENHTKNEAEILWVSSPPSF
ncbi:MAG: XRE family transcriptional regulator [Defluviitaleaceae bacterium]|nr:XRE family transcriptional regulator [Defluviitaleaceae bacterium]MCL2275984.1 XRE family transcriptional regulator [Defluviitaleaceae bacterium]